MKPEQIHTRLYLKELRRELRKNPTPAETILWQHVRNKQLGATIQRQHSIGNYITDFYCAKYKLIIELDGQVHFTPEAQEYDQQRTNYLSELGFRVIRFENITVIEHLDEVLATIKSNMTENLV